MSVSTPVANIFAKRLECERFSLIFTGENRD
jgi:hypothetical protein